MSAISDSISVPVVAYETKWDEVFVLSTRQQAHVATPAWRPAVNAYRCSDAFVVFVDLAGVRPEDIEVAAEGHRVTIRGGSPPLEPAGLRSQLAQLLALEIDQGTFERVLDLPQEIDPRGVTTEYDDGVLRVRLPILG